MDGRGSAILALELVPKNLIFAKKSYPNIYFARFYACHFSKENWREPLVLYLMNDFYAVFLIFSQERVKFSHL